MQLHLREKQELFEANAALRTALRRRGVADAQLDGELRLINSQAGAGCCVAMVGCWVLAAGCWVLGGAGVLLAGTPHTATVPASPPASLPTHLQPFFCTAA